MDGDVDLLGTIPVILIQIPINFSSKHSFKSIEQE